MSNGKFDNELKNCPLCGSLEIEPAYHIKSYREAFRISHCRLCRFMFMNPPFSDSAISSFYDEDYYSGKGDYAYHDEREIHRYSSYVWDARIKNIRRYVRSGNFLDVGSSFGGLLRSAGRYFAPYGIEISQYAGEYSASIPGLTVHSGTLFDHPFSHDFFSVITMVELIEHLKDPAAAIKECYKLLENGGMLLIQTANMDGLQARLLRERYSYFMPGHLSYFNRENLTSLLSNTGFRRVKSYIPVDFGLLPKLKKSRHSFKSLPDYLNWLRISWYHFISKIHFKNFATTSSLVIYAFK